MKQISLTNSHKMALVDDKDYKCLSKFKWCLVGAHASTTTRPYLYMHEMLMGKAPKGLQWDHHDGNSLNNRRKNLRLATPSQNQINRRRQKSNTTGYKGVCPRGDGYVMQLWTGSRRLWKYFHDPIQAAKAYDAAAKKYHGEFARTNFPMRFPRVYRFPRDREV